jgi:carbazole 1,9a-dioxygenase terminal dioxygenase component
MTGLVSPEVLRQVKGWAPYVEAKLGFRNHWYPIGLSEEVAERTPLPVTLLSEKILLNRIDGVVYALKDRCLHRGVTLSDKLECLTKDTISCWYHGWTYRWDTGRLVDIITNPQSIQIGRHHLRVYPVREAKGIVFVYVGDGAPHDLSEDVPPGFLDDDRAIFGIHRMVAANWRMGAENGFDAGHVFIHKDSVLLEGNDIALPLGFAPGGSAQLTRSQIEPGAPKGVFDLLGAHSRPVFEGTVEGAVALHGHMGAKRVADNISIWLPGVLRVEPFPDPGLTQYEWYVPIDEGNHLYFQTIGKLCATEAEVAAFRREFDEKWVPMALHGFNDDDVLARLSTQRFYADDRGWVKEILYEPDKAIIEWRRLASQYNRGVQTAEHL